jgi:hypothetical protein
MPSRTSRNAMYREECNDLLYQRISAALVAVVNATPAGASGALMYTAVMEHIDLRTYGQMLRALVNAGRITHRGDRYFPAGD